MYFCFYMDQTRPESGWILCVCAVNLFFMQMMMTMTMMIIMMRKGWNENKVFSLTMDIGQGRKRAWLVVWLCSVQGDLLFRERKGLKNKNDVELCIWKYAVMW